MNTPDSSPQGEDCLRIALVNNMPDAALEDTEGQFAGLLSAAADDLPVQLGFYSLSTVPRSNGARDRLARRYRPSTSLSNETIDAVIITGTEPHQPDLRDEPYWDELSSLFAWAEANTQSAVLSCLAAHAGVLYADGIVRHPQTEKRFGIFEHEIVSEHPLTRGISEPLRIPHSRWNGLSEAELSSSGYSVLTRSAEAGTDMFVKMRGRSLFVHFQGHPEYGPQTLLKEYRRDVARYLYGERETYPSMPRGYFNPSSEKRLVDFQAFAMSKPGRDCLTEFPAGPVAAALDHAWRPAAVRIYGNWLKYIAMRKAEAAVSGSTKAAVATTGPR